MPTAVRDKSDQQATRPAAHDVYVAADRITVRAGVVVPDGVLHVVDEEWQAICGAGRFGYRFTVGSVRTTQGSCGRCAAAGIVDLDVAV